jgi:hypothetical protein
MDDFENGRWRVVWSGWRTAPNQFLEFGFWVAKDADVNGFQYATTTGVVDVARNDYETLDTSLAKDWPTPILLSDDERDDLKQRAFDGLLARLKALDADGAAR